ncbi:MAG TPA: DpnD/PcfM family protein [Clostridia bacterium]|nr:DpnD/PcfM family protein [Clostridia bacterium]HPQ47402.1 DpnD/PcfM family protein [Clostridia bacterium]HRX42625.1 DpnD/PcfM family protein [Clostridia bacterium]
MSSYNIKITETMEREICIEAVNELEAITEAMKRYQDRKYVLFPGVHVSTDFNIAGENQDIGLKAAI